MQISETYLPYDFNTLILVCDRSHARLYQAHQKEFNFVEELTNDRLKIDDAERYTSSDGFRSFTAQDEDLKEREAHLFYQHLGKRLFEQKQKHGFEKLILVVPHDDKNVLIEALHMDVRNLLERAIAKQLTKISEDQLIDVLDKERRV